MIPGQLLVQCRPFYSRTDRGYVAGSIAFTDQGDTLTVWPRILRRQTESFTADLDYVYDLTEGDSFLFELPSPDPRTRKLYVPSRHDDELPEPPMVLEYLELRNYRCFKKLLVPLSGPSLLPGQWTCVAGINGSGKSAVLEALCLALLGEPLIRELGSERLDRIRRKERGRSHDAEIRLWLREGRDRRYIELRLEDPDSLYRRDKSKAVSREMFEFWKDMRSRLFVGYGATRNLIAHPSDSFQYARSDLRRLMTIFDPLTQLASADVLVRSSRGQRVVKRLLANLVEQVFRKDELVSVVKGDQISFIVEDEPLEAIDLPDGFRSFTAWMADLCAAWVDVAPDEAKEGDPTKIEGIALIDEIDLHLHPSLQREIVTRLRSVLPRVQWVVTTHSPLVLSSFDSREIVALDRDEPDGIRKLDRQILGFSTDEVYRWLMDTPASSSAIEEVLRRQADMGSEQRSKVAHILRSSPEVNEKQAKAAADDFKRRIARIDTLKQ